MAAVIHRTVVPNSNRPSATRFLKVHVAFPQLKLLNPCQLSARALIPLSTRRIIGKSPDSSSTSAESAAAGASQAYRCLSRVISRVRAPSSGRSLQDHVLSGFSQNSHLFGSKAFALNAGSR
jgi:hypothetical protein